MSYDFEDQSKTNNEKTFLHSSIAGESFERSNFEVESSFRVISYKLRMGISKRNRSQSLKSRTEFRDESLIEDAILNNLFFVE